MTIAKLLRPTTNMLLTLFSRVCNISMINPPFFSCDMANEGQTVNNVSVTLCGRRMMHALAGNSISKIHVIHCKKKIYIYSSHLSPCFHEPNGRCTYIFARIHFDGILQHRIGFLQYQLSLTGCNRILYNVQFIFQYIVQFLYVDQFWSLALRQPILNGTGLTHNNATHRIEQINLL